jgi:hypothetical protein
MTACFVNETKQTTLLPPKTLRDVNAEKARQAEEIAVSAQGKRSTARRSGLCTLTDVEELIGSLVSATPGEGCFPLLPHTDTALYCKVGTSACHINMLKESTVLATAPNATNEQWRRFIGQQLMLLAELIVFCVPAFFTDNGATVNPLGKRKARGAVRSELGLNKLSFVPTRAIADTTVVRGWALRYARRARICDL